MVRCTCMNQNILLLSYQERKTSSIVNTYQISSSKAKDDQNTQKISTDYTESTLTRRIYFTLWWLSRCAWKCITVK